MSKNVIFASMGIEVLGETYSVYANEALQAYLSGMLVALGGVVEPDKRFVRIRQISDRQQPSFVEELRAIIGKSTLNTWSSGVQESTGDLIVYPVGRKPGKNVELSLMQDFLDRSKPKRYLGDSDIMWMLHYAGRMGVYSTVTYPLNIRGIRMHHLDLCGLGPVLGLEPTAKKAEVNEASLRLEANMDLVIQKAASMISDESAFEEEGLILPLRLRKRLRD